VVLDESFEDLMGITEDHKTIDGL